MGNWGTGRFSQSLKGRFFFKKFFIVIQLQLCAFSPHPSTPPQPNPPPSPTSTLPLNFVHVSKGRFLGSEFYTQQGVTSSHLVIWIWGVKGDGLTVWIFASLFLRAHFTAITTCFINFCSHWWLRLPKRVKCQKVETSSLNEACSCTPGCSKWAKAMWPGHTGCHKSGHIPPQGLWEVSLKPGLKEQI